MNYADILKKYDVVIGLEVHCQLATRSKMFSSASASFGNEPNTNIDPACVALPGALPVVNEEAVDLAIRMGLATECHIAPISVFARKNYFYPDLPKGYQLTQFDKPICLDGQIILKSEKTIRIERIHIEEDAGKNVHVGNASLVDYNRSGVALIEIVSHPDISSPEEATEYLKRLHTFAVHLEVSNGDMEKGNFRCDANVSIKLKSEKTLGTRTEIKNINSFKYLEKAITHEVERQYEVIEEGGKITMETRGYDSERNVTYTQRSKEQAHDYRFFPEPDLPPLIVTKERIEKVRKLLPELPEVRAKRFEDIYGLPAYDAGLIVSNKYAASYFENLVKALVGKVEPKACSNYFMSDVLRSLKIESEKTGLSVDEITEFPVSLSQSVELLSLVSEGIISQRIAKEVFEELIISQKMPREIVKDKGLVQVSDDSEISKVIEKVLNESPAQLADYISGKEKLFSYFVGQAMKATGGKLNPAKLNELLKSAIEVRRK